MFNHENKIKTFYTLLTASNLREIPKEILPCNNVLRKNMDLDNYRYYFNTVIDTFR